MEQANSFDVDSLFGYCEKYNIEKSLPTAIVALFKSFKQELKKFPPEYSWEKEGHYGYEITVCGVRIKIEMRNMRNDQDWSNNNVTSIRIDGVNWNVKK